jgi:hypothetical protein
MRTKYLRRKEMNRCGSYKEYYNSLAEEWIYINGIPWWQHNTISLSIYEVSKHKRVTVICLYKKMDGTFLYPFKLHISQSKIKGNIKNGKIIQSNVNGCWCYQVPIDMFTEGFAHIPGRDYDLNLKSSDFIKC